MNSAILSFANQDFKQNDPRQLEMETITEDSRWQAVLARDGTSDGYDLALTAAVSDAVAVPVIASGGAGELDHLVDALRAGADAALCASIFHYGRHTIAEAKEFANKVGVKVPMARS